MLFKDHCVTTCDLSIKPYAAIYFKELKDTNQISKLKNIPMIMSFSKKETQQFRSIKAVSDSFNNINRPRYGQTLKSVIKGITIMEILN